MRPYQALILATSIYEGTVYAQALGLEDYRIATPRSADRIQGLIVRAVVVSPRFAYLLAYEHEAGHASAWRLFDTANRNAAKSGAPRG